MRRAALVAALLSTAGAAQGPVTAPPAPASQAAVDALAARIPSPATSAPPMETVGGSPGTAGSYRPADAATPRITRAGIVTTDANGGWSIAWSTSLAAAPVTLPIPVNATGEPVVCNVATTTMTGASGRCWYARTLPATIVALSGLVSYDLFGASAAGITVQVLAIPKTQ